MFGIGDAVTAGLQIIDKFIPDPKAKADAIFKLKTLEQQGDMASLNAFVTEMTGQVEINKIEPVCLSQAGDHLLVGSVEVPLLTNL